VIKIIEEFLSTKTVSIWRRQPDGDSFKLDLVAASDELWGKYKSAGIKTLPPDSFTGKAASGEAEPVRVTYEEIKTKFHTPEFAYDNQLRSMTVVPIKIGNEIYGAIDVFSRRDTTLFDDEVMSLRILAGKAAVAIQSSTLIESSSDAGRISPGDDLRSILKRIADNAVETLRAEPVILFRYDVLDNPKFDIQAVIAGKLYYRNLKIATNENHMANLVLQSPNPLYLRNEEEYLEFERHSKRKWVSDRFKEDFWHRERIKSLAAFKLEHRSQILGVMFINYREPQDFSDSSRERVFKIFGSQAAAAIYNVKISDQNKKFWEKQRGDSLSLTVSEVVSSLAHNSGHLLNRINNSFSKLDDLATKDKLTERQLQRLKSEVTNMKEPLLALKKDFDRLKTYRQFDELNLKEHDLNVLVRRSLDMLRDTFNKQRVDVDDRYATNLPNVICDENQINHVLLNLFLNAAEAMKHKGTLSVTTSLKGREVEIRVSDTGAGIPIELRDKIFQLGFSTKKAKAGSGHGLPISRYIVREHGGRMEIGPSGKKGATFFIYLPI
jgi:signal transduction histidine kinase